MQSIFRPAARRETLGEQSEGSRRDGGLKMLCIMIQSSRGAGDSEIVIWEIILRDFWGAILRPLVTPYRRRNANARV
jgi:hypothetical protein